MTIIFHGLKQPEILCIGTVHNLFIDLRLGMYIITNQRKIAPSGLICIEMHFKSTHTVFETQASA